MKQIGLTLAFSMILLVYAPLASGQVEISVSLHDSSLAGIAVVDPDANDPAIGGADFLVALNTSDSTNLATYSQRISYDSDLVRYVAGVFQNPLPGGFGKNPGSAVIDGLDSDIGPGSRVDCTLSGMSGYTGPQILLLIGFEVTGAPASTGQLGVQDNPGSTAPYADALTQNISHTSPGTGASFTVLGEPLPTPTAGPPTPTNTVPAGAVEISLAITDGAGNPLTEVENTNAAAGGTDFLVELNCSATENLGTYSQRISYDSGKVRYRMGIFNNPLPSGFGKDAGILVVDTSRYDEGAGSDIGVTCIGIAGQSGPQTLAILGFDVIAGSGTGRLSVGDNPDSTAPFGDVNAENIPHTSPGTPVDYSIVSGPTPTPGGETPTNTPPAGVAAISVTLHDSSLGSISQVDPNTDDPAIGGADFLVALNTSDSANLATYSQRIAYDSAKVRYVDGVFQNPLQAGFGKNPGSAVIDGLDSDIGAGSRVDCTLSGMSGYTGPQVLLLIGFEATGAPAETGQLTVRDNPGSTAPYADSLTQDIPHTSPGTPASFTIVGEPLPTNTPGGPTDTPVLPTNTPVVGGVAISLSLHDSSLASITEVDAGVNDPAIGGADFLVALNTSDSKDLATYSQRIAYDSGLVRYVDGVFQNPLEAGFGKNPGSAVIDGTDADLGAGSRIDCTLSGMSGYTGPQILLLIGFEVTGSPTETGQLTVQDNPGSTAPYADSLTANIPHTSPGSPASFTIAGGVGPTNTPAVPTSTPILPTNTPSLPTSTPSGELAVISLSLHDSTLAPITVVDPDTNDGEIGGADFLVALNTSETTDLATYSQRISYDSGLVRYMDGIFQNPLEGGFGKNPGSAVIDGTDADLGPGSRIDCTLSGMSGYTGPQILLLIGFEVTGPAAATGQITVEDNPNSTAPWANELTQNIPHTSPGTPADFEIAGGTVDTPTPVATPTPPVTPLPTLTNERSDINQDGRVDANDLLIFQLDWHKVVQ